MLDYGYGELEDQIVSLFRHYPPDFAKAEELLCRGANLNARSGKDPDDNMLSEILCGYWNCEGCDLPEAYMQHDIEREAGKHGQNREAPIGASMVRIVRFFLDHGFSVSADQGRRGAQCLAMLVVSTFDSAMLEAARLLLDAGAKNVIAYDGEKAIDAVGMEGSFQGCVAHDQPLANLYEAFYQMLLALDEGRPYQGVDDYTACYGKKIERVLATKPAEGSVFYDLALPSATHENCYTQTLFFAYDGGYLISSQYADVWTDTVLPQGEYVDVTERFRAITGSNIEQITFGYSELCEGAVSYGQPVVSLNMDNGITVRFSVNFGEVADADRAAYYCLVRE